jgi:hypothetical protein
MHVDEFESFDDFIDNDSPHVPAHVNIAVFKNRRQAAVAGIVADQVDVAVMQLSTMKFNEIFIVYAFNAIDFLFDQLHVVREYSFHDNIFADVDFSKAAPANEISKYHIY